MAFAVIAVDHLKLNFSSVFQIWSMVTLVILLVSSVILASEQVAFSNHAAIIALSAMMAAEN